VKANPSNSRLSCEAIAVTRAHHDYIVAKSHTSFIQARQKSHIERQPTITLSHDSLQEVAGRTLSQPTSSSPENVCVVVFQLPRLQVLHFFLAFREFLRRLNILFLYRSVAANNVVPETSEIFTTSKVGDALAVKHLFESGRASPYDITAQRSTLLRVSRLPFQYI